MSTENQLPLVLTPKDLAKVLKVSLNTVYEYMHREGFPYFKVGKQYRIPRDKLLLWLDSVNGNDNRSTAKLY